VIEAFTVLAGYFIYELTPRRWRSNINWWFWVIAIGLAVAFAGWSLLTTGVLPEPAEG
jgi:multisubunit Na+/H+ antiporter MnhB subunit